MAITLILLGRRGHLRAFRWSVLVSGRFCLDDFLLFYRLYNMDNFRLNCNDRLIYFDERSFKVGRVFFLHRNVRFVVHELGLLM